MEDVSFAAVTVVWNHRDRLPLLLRSLDDQTRRPDHTIVVDAASQDGVSAWLAQAYPYVSSLRLFQRHGLGHAWRQAAKFALQRVAPDRLGRAWVFFVSPEILLAKDVAERLLAEAAQRPALGMIGPAVLRAWYQGEAEDGLEEIEPTELLEGLALAPRPSFAWRAHGQGESIRSHPSEPREVFMPSPLAFACRADVLAQALEIGGLLLPWNTQDGLFFDLAWRCHWLGAEAWTVPEACAWRVERRGSEAEAASWKQRLVREEDRRQVVALHLAGGLNRLKTWPARAWARLRYLPASVWAVLVGFRAAVPDAGLELRQVAERALRAHRAPAARTLERWLFRERA